MTTDITGADSQHLLDVARSTLAEANEGCDWCLYATFAQALIAQACKLYAGEPFGAELEGTAYALDTTNIELCLSLFPCAVNRLPDSSPRNAGVEDALLTSVKEVQLRIDTLLQQVHRRAR